MSIHIFLQIWCCLKICNQIRRHFSQFAPKILLFYLDIFLIFYSIWRWILLWGMHIVMIIIFLRICWHLIDNSITSIPHVYLLIILILSSIISWNFIWTFIILYSISKILYFFLHANPILSKLRRYYTNMQFNPSN